MLIQLFCNTLHGVNRKDDIQYNPRERGGDRIHETFEDYRILIKIPIPGFGKENLVGVSEFLNKSSF